jgi:CubicO group peptidase (beta-lactamase class C family)
MRVPSWWRALGCTAAFVAPLALAAPTFPDAAASDPAALGWMVGSPPPADRQIRFDDGSYYRFPQLRWTFSHWREFVPTVNVSRGVGAVAVLPRAERPVIDSIAFIVPDSGREMTWAASLAANYTDGIVVLHRGRIVYERYFGAGSAERPHIAFSATKSFFGTIAALLIAEGKLDPNATVGAVLPELKGSGFGDATVAQVLDMTTAIKFSEVYGDPASDIASYARAVGMFPRPAGYTGAGGVYEYLAAIPKDGEHGPAFAYRSVNSDVVGWLVTRAAGSPLARVLEETIWSRIGAESDAYLQVDATGTPLVAGGFNARLRDMARFGEMIRLGGRFNGQQILPTAVVADIRRGGDRDAFAKAGYKTLPGWTYHDQWWISNNAHGAFMARGVHGQAIYIDPKAEMVIARFASHPLAANANLDPTSLPAYAALADYLIAHPR